MTAPPVDNAANEDGFYVERAAKVLTTQVPAVGRLHVEPALLARCVVCPAQQGVDGAQRRVRAETWREIASGEFRPVDPRLTVKCIVGPLVLAAFYIAVVQALTALPAQLRRQFGREQPFLLKNLGEESVFSEFEVTNPQSKNSYRLLVRGDRPAAAPAGAGATQ